MDYVNAMWIVTVAVLTAAARQSSAEVAQKSLTRTEFLHELLKGYDNRVPPNFDTDEAAVVECDIFIGSFDSISETTMDYVVSIFLRQRWEDPRLQYFNQSKENVITLDARIADAIWLPDMFFTNEKRAYFHDVMIPNKFIRLYKNGTIYYSARVSLTLSCPMKLHKFPLDTQKCWMQMESYAYTVDRLQFKWRGEDAVEISKDLQLPQFVLNSISVDDCTKTYNTGQFTCLQVNFVLSRDIGFYMIQTYVPSALIVILSWVSFWINIDAVPARISLGVLTILTMTTQTTGSRQSLPRVSYIKAIDVWMSMCLVFVFAALLEFAIVNVLSRKDKKEFRLATIQQRKNMDNEKERSDEDNAELPPGGSISVAHNGTLLVQDLYGDKRRSRGVDKSSRKLFPLAFIFFNIVYWMTYLLWKPADKNGYV